MTKRTKCGSFCTMKSSPRTFRRARTFRFRVYECEPNPRAGSHDAAARTIKIQKAFGGSRRNRIGGRHGRDPRGTFKNVSELCGFFFFFQPNRPAPIAAPGETVRGGGGMGTRFSLLPGIKWAANRRHRPRALLLQDAYLVGVGFSN